MFSDPFGLSAKQTKATSLKRAFVADEGGSNAVLWTIVVAKRRSTSLKLPQVLACESASRNEPFPPGLLQSLQVVCHLGAYGSGLPGWGRNGR